MKSCTVGLARNVNNGWAQSSISKKVHAATHFKKKQMDDI